MAERTDDHTQIFGTPSLAEPQGPQSQPFSRIGLRHRCPGVGNPARQRVSTERYATGYFGVHRPILTLVFTLWAKGV
ncbi:hypothetical protein MBOE_58740 [Mycolicibacterium boenickei]|uniref:Uncharacterized protein n=1 Tax=Mycolicibacterium boenickei TaxID=146017 RepID=A0ABM7J4R7_9MYCO|nr:hypothetical protein MBOE_58740 [Mycolicibacterium boenickei]